MADGAFPFVVVVYRYFAVEAANVAIIRLGVKLRILDIIVNVFYNVLHGGQVVAHIGYFDVGNSSARGNLLELAFKREFGECVDMLAHVHMITVCIVALVRDVGYLAEALFINPCEAVAKRFRRRTVQPEAQPRFLFPFFAMLAQGIHNFKRKLRSFGVGMRNSLDKLCYFVKSYITQRNGRVAV